MPRLGADMEDAILLEWKVKEGDRVQKGDIIAEIETVKGDIDVEVFEDGIVEKLIAQPGERLPVGTVLAFINNNGKEVPEKSVEVPTIAAPITSEKTIKEAPATKPMSEEISTRPTPSPSISPNRPTFRHNASPLARKIAADLGIDLEQVKGTGEGGIIHKVDVERYAASLKEEAMVDGKAMDIIQKIPLKESPKRDRTGKMRTAIAAAMSRSNQEIPHYYLETSIDMSTAMNWLQVENEKRPVQKRLLAAVLLLKAAALALKKVPELNGYWLDNRLQPQKGIHIGFAISLRGGGLVIPAIHDIDTKNMDELMDSLTDVTERARTGKLRSSELTDSTITITSMGDRGVEKVFGVIYPPQVAIIGFGKIIEKPWAENGMIGVRPVLTVTLAADHRATDGRVGAKFLRALDKYLQEPAAL